MQESLSFARLVSDDIVLAGLIGNQLCHNACISKESILHVYFYVVHNEIINYSTMGIYRCFESIISRCSRSQETSI